MTEKTTSIELAASFTVGAFLTAFLVFFHEDFGIANISELRNHPQVLFDYLFKALGGSLIFPLITIAILSIFKRNRNSRTRRNTFIAWSTATILVLLLGVVAK